jgi:hypothetical protein
MPIRQFRKNAQSGLAAIIRITSPSLPDTPFEYKFAIVPAMLASVGYASSLCANFSPHCGARLIPLGIRY